MVRVSFSAAVVAWCFTPTQAAEGAKVLDQPSDLDLTGVVKAINFGNSSDQTISGVRFRAAPANATVDGVKNVAQGMVKVGSGSQTVPHIGDSDEDNALEQILGTSIFGSNQGKNIDMDIPVPNGFYRVQLILYDGWKSVTGNRRDVDHYVEGALAAKHYHDYPEQGNTPHAGNIATYVFEVTDGNIDIKLAGLVPNAHLSGLVISKVPVPKNQKTPNLKKDEKWVVADRTDELLNKMDPELKSQYIALKRDMTRRGHFKQFANQTFRQSDISRGIFDS